MMAIKNDDDWLDFDWSQNGATSVTTQNFSQMGTISLMLTLFWTKLTESEFRFRYDDDAFPLLSPSLPLPSVVLIFFLCSPSCRILPLVLQ